MKNKCPSIYPLKPSVLCIEPNLTGHRSVYLTNVVLALLEQNEIVVIVTLSNQVIRSNLSDILNSYTDRVHLIKHCEKDIPSPKSSFFRNLEREMYYWCLLRSIYNNVSSKMPVARVFLPYMDYCIYTFGLLGSPFGRTPFSGICMRQSFHLKKVGVKIPSSRMDYIKERLFIKTMKNSLVNKLFTIDELLFEYFRKINREKLNNIASKIFFLPDVVEEISACNKDIYREFLGINRKAKIILVYGAIDDRKCIKRLLNVVQTLDKSNRPVILLAGEQSIDIRNYLDTAIGQELRKSEILVEVNRYLSENEEADYFTVCDAVWLVYESHFTSSGVLNRAVLYNRPVFANNEGLVGHYVGKYKLGWLVNSDEELEECLSCFVSGESYVQQHYNGKMNIEYLEKFVEEKQKWIKKKVL